MHTQAPSFNYQNARVIFFTALQKFGTGRRDCLISDCFGLGCWPLQAAVVWCSDHLARVWMQNFKFQKKFPAPA